jgi:hypothetical protein
MPIQCSNRSHHAQGAPQAKGHPAPEVPTVVRLRKPNSGHLWPSLHQEIQPCHTEKDFCQVWEERGSLFSLCLPGSPFLAVTMLGRNGSYGLLGLMQDPVLRALHISSTGFYSNPGKFILQFHSTSVQLAEWLKWSSACLAWIQTPVLPRKQTSKKDPDV